MAGPDLLFLEELLRRIAGWRAGHAGLFVLGICGSQGSGKSTLVEALEARLAADGVKALRLSLDDMYLTRVERQALGAAVHPLLATRGVPGTHDVALGLETISALRNGDPVRLPRFDKGRDDRADPATWPLTPSSVQVLLLEGWCLGARPQSDVSAPVNTLEAGEDPQGVWRGYANAALAGAYQTLFAAVDRLVLLAAPDWEVVARWREEQELALRETAAPLAMDPEQVARFIQHYERLTRHILAEMPARADLVVRLGPQREVLEIIPPAPDPAH